MMYKKLLSFFILLFLSQNLLGQDLFASMEPGTLIFKDGTQIDGLVKIIGNSVKYRASKEEDKIKYDYTQLYRVFFKDSNRQDFLYEYVKLENYEKPQLLNVIVEGYLMLYSNTQNYYNSGGMGFSMGMGGGMYFGGGGGSSTSYYIKRPNESFATFFMVYGSIPPQSFKKVVRSYFADCPELVEKVNKKEFRKSDFMSVVEFYNKNCSKPE